MQACQDNLIYLSGPHGSGKSTLMKELRRENQKFLVPELFSRSIKFDTEPEHRQILKICEKAIESFEYLKIAKENQGKIVLGNRCIYDSLAYLWVYYKKNWVSEEIYEIYNKHINYFFRDENLRPRVIILNPGFEIILKHLEERWKKNKKKWKEEDLEYTELACQAFEAYNDKENILYLDHEINLDSRIEIIEIGNWCQNKYKEVYILGK